MNLVDLAQEKTSLADQNLGDGEGHSSHDEPAASYGFVTPAVIVRVIVRFFPPWKDAVNLALTTPPIWPIYVITAGRVTTRMPICPAP